jgi:predicted  nucleic acid-binding Zn-ribbon protein
MSPYELKKLQVEYKRVNAAREEQELRVLEIMEQVERLQKSIDVSKAKEEELMAKINAPQEAN